MTKPDDLSSEDWRRTNPRFQNEAFKKNLAIVEKVKAFAKTKGCTPGQLALAWVLGQGDDVVPIPGTRRVKYLLENLGAAKVKVSGEELKELAEVVASEGIVGERYAEKEMHSTFAYGDKKE